MKKYTNGDREILATERAFELLYKEQGFKEVVETPKKPKNNNKQANNKDKAQKG